MPLFTTTFLVMHVVNVFLVYFAVPGVPSLQTGEDAMVFELLNATAVQLFWNPPINSNGVILDYQVLYYGYLQSEEVVVTTMCCKCTQFYVHVDLAHSI